MPIRIPNNLPAMGILTEENIFVISQERAEHQDIRPLKIAILNLMPTKIVTETQILRVIGNTPIQVDVVLLNTSSHISKNTPNEHLSNFYKNFNDVKDDKFDGLVITGAPVEHLNFEDVNYWNELVQIMEWSKHNVYSTLHICWAAQAGLYYHYGVNKYTLDKKMFGVFKHTINKKNIKLLRGFDDEFYVPHSRYTDLNKEDILKVKNLNILSESEESGIYIVKSEGGRQIFVTGHSEYDSNTLDLEYKRDISKGLKIEIPKNYYQDDDPDQKIIVRWKSHGNLLFTNWLNYYVYQETPFDLNILNSGGPFDI